MKTFVCILLLLFSFSLFAQQIDRVMVQGQVFVPKGDDDEGISIYNASAQTGTTTNKDGEFELLVGMYDRIVVTALQFQSFTIIADEGVVQNQLMRINLNASINQLDEVVVRPYDLSGSIEVDVARINVFESPNWDLSYENLEFESDFSADSQSSIKTNAAEEALNARHLQNGFNILGLFTAVITSIFPSKTKKSKSDSSLENGQVVTVLQQRYQANFYVETYQIPLEKVDAFIYFVEESGVQPNLLREENELELFALLQEQSAIFKKRLNDE